MGLRKWIEDWKHRKELTVEQLKKVIANGGTDKNGKKVESKGYVNPK